MSDVFHNWLPRPLLSDVFAQLDSRLSDQLLYHGANHTRHVMANALLLAEAESMCETEIRLVLAAALFHDTGFMWQYDANEPLGAEYAQELLPEYDFSAVDIETVTTAILATALPQSPDGLIGEVLCDADLAYLGSGNYFTVSEYLRRELAVMIDRHFDERQWLEFQLQFLKSHTYFTTSARQFFKQKKEGIIRYLEATKGELDEV